MNMQCSIAPGSSRREFLKTSAVAVAGAGLVSALAPPVHAAGSDTLKIALIGCGNRGTGALVQALNTSGAVKLWALADTFSDRVEMCLEHVNRELRGEHTGMLHSTRIDIDTERHDLGVGLVDLFQQRSVARSEIQEIAPFAGKHGCRKLDDGLVVVVHGQGRGESIVRGIPLRISVLRRDRIL